MVAMQVWAAGVDSYLKHSWVLVKRRCGSVGMWGNLEVTSTEIL